MAKVTAVIDIGSNSVRMAVFRKTSRFGFHLLEEVKARVRISEDSYKNGGNLQKEPIDRAVAAIGDFLEIAKFYKARKILAVATSAVRDASNKEQFLHIIKEKHKLNIKVIDGMKEAYYGGVAASNLLYLSDGITVDIGGGSTELAFIKNRKIIKTISLDLGTVRLKELFSDEKNIENAKEFIRKELDRLDDYKCENVIGIGGTLRAVSEAIIKREEYYLNIIHGFEYEVKNQKEFFQQIIGAKKRELKSLGFKQERVDVIREGTLIFIEIIKKIQGKKVIASGVGVREGVFLSDLLRNSNGMFPDNFNPSVRSLIDKFDLNRKEGEYLSKISMKLFDVLQENHKLPKEYKRLLNYAAKLSSLGKTIHFYKRGIQAYEIALLGLSYGLSHKERFIIANILNNQQKKDLVKYSGTSEIKWLSAILFVVNSINKNKTAKDVIFEIEGSRLVIKSDSSYLSQEYFKNLKIIDGVEFCWI
ncbi:MAG: Ppx/GppA family phosphatase [Campylobacterales bacterium]|nr:Ppx/GppA family phosphatase [Campylobacterales bacterium]